MKSLRIFLPIFILLLVALTIGLVTHNDIWIHSGFKLFLFLLPALITSIIVEVRNKKSNQKKSKGLLLPISFACIVTLLILSYIYAFLIWPT